MGMVAHGSSKFMGAISENEKAISHKERTQWRASVSFVFPKHERRGHRCAQSSTVTRSPSISENEQGVDIPFFNTSRVKVKSGANQFPKSTMTVSLAVLGNRMVDHDPDSI